MTDFKDILADLNLTKSKSNALPGFVHSGFKNQLDKIWQELVTGLDKLPNRKIFLTGHSLGAAMATICASRLMLTHHENLQCLYTFGSPRVGCKEFVDSLKLKHYRFVNNNDLITSLPGQYLGGF